jgi:hypothetical protein
VQRSIDHPDRHHEHNRHHDPEASYYHAVSSPSGLGWYLRRPLCNHVLQNGFRRLPRVRLRPPRVLAQDSTGATGAFLRPDPLLLNDLDANLVVAITGASRSKPSRGDIERFGLPTQDAVAGWRLSRH